MKKISRIKNVKGHYYYAIKYSLLEMLLDKTLRNFLFKVNIFYILKLLIRNRFSFHITVPVKKNKVLPEYVDDISYIGVGSVSNDISRTWYIIVESETLKNINPNQDYHITLGFMNTDVHKNNNNERVVKDKSTLII